MRTFWGDNNEKKDRTFCYIYEGVVKRFYFLNKISSVLKDNTIFLPPDLSHYFDYPVMYFGEGDVLLCFKIDNNSYPIDDFEMFIVDERTKTMSSAQIMMFSRFFKNCFISDNNTSKNDEGVLTEKKEDKYLSVHRKLF